MFSTVGVFAGSGGITNPLIALGWEFFLEAQNFDPSGNPYVWDDSSGNNVSATRSAPKMSFGTSSYLNVDEIVQVDAQGAMFLGNDGTTLDPSPFSGSEYTILCVGEQGSVEGQWLCPIGYVTTTPVICFGTGTPKGYIYRNGGGVQSFNPTDDHGIFVLRVSDSEVSGFKTHVTLNGEEVINTTSYLPLTSSLTGEGWNIIGLQGGNRTGKIYSVAYASRCLSDSEVNYIGNYYAGITDATWTDL